MLNIFCWIVFLIWACPVSLSAQQLTPAPEDSNPADFSLVDTVRVVYPVVMPPYTFMDEAGEAQGLAIDLLRLWSDKTGIPLQFTSAPWEQGLQMMREGQADVHASLYFTEERDTYLDYAAIVSSSAGGIFYHRTVFGINSPEDLKGYRVGVVRGGYHEQYFKMRYPEVVLAAYPEFPEMVSAARAGEIRVFVDDVGATLYRLREWGLVDEFHCDLQNILYHNNFWLAVQEGRNELAEIIRQGMALITPEERATLERKWLGAADTKTPGVLDIAMQSDFPPFSFLNSYGQPSGLFVDIWRLWAEKTGRKIEFHATDWNTSLDNIKSGVADIHSGLFYSETRAEWLDYSRPFYETGSCFCFLRDRDVVIDPDSLAAKKIGVVRGSYQGEYLRTHYPAVDVISYATIVEMLEAVVSGDVSACLSEHLSTEAVVSRLGLSGKFNAHAQILFTNAFYAGVNKGNSELLSLVNEAFDALSINELAGIEQRWVTDDENLYYRSTPPEISLTGEEQAWLDEHPDIRIGLPEGLAPYVMDDEAGNQVGILVDFLNELNRTLGSNIILTTMPSSKIFEMSANRDIDVVYAVEPEAAEREGLLPTDVWAIGYPAIYSLREFSFTTLDDMDGKTVVLRPNTLWDDEIVQPYAEQGNIVYAETPLDAMTMVQNREADLYLGLTSHQYTITKYRLFGMSQAYVFPESQIPFVMGIRSDWPMLVSILNKGLATIGKEGLSAIVANWIQVAEDEKGIELTDEEQAWLDEHPDIRLAFPLGHEPSLMKDDHGHIIGILADYWDLLNSKLGTDVRYELVPMSELSELIKQKEVEGMLFASPKLIKAYDLVGAGPAIQSYVAIYGRETKESFRFPQNLVGKKVAVLKGYDHTDHAVSPVREQVDLIEVKSPLEGLQALHQGTVDFYIGSIGNNYLAAQYRLIGVKPIHVFWNNPYSIVPAVRSDLPELAAILNKGVDLIADAEFNKIFGKWTQIEPVKYEISFTTEEQAWLAQNHTVRIRIAHFPPFMIVEKDAIRGISVDYLNLVADRAGVQFLYVPSDIPWLDALDNVKNRLGPDLLSSMMPTPEREAYLTFSGAYMETPRVIFTRSDGDYVSGMEDLTGKTIAVCRGTVVHRELEAKYPDIQLLAFDSDEHALEGVALGKADAYIGNLTLASYVIQERNFTDLKIAAPSQLGDHVFHFGIRSDWPELRGIIDKVLDNMSPVERAAIRNKYVAMRYEYGIDTGDLVKWVLIVLGVTGSIIFLFVFWNRSLTRQVNFRTAELKQSEEKFHSLFTNMMNSIAHCRIIVDEKNQPVDFIYLDVNDSYERLIGAEKSDIVGRKVSEVFPTLKAEHPEVLEIYGEVARFGKDKKFELLFKPLNRWLDVSAYSIQQGYFTAVIEDITERKQAVDELQESEKRFRATFEQAAVGIAHVSPEGRFLRINQKFCDIVGYSRDEMRQLMFQDITYPDDLESDLEHVNELLSGRGTTYSMEKRYIRKNGELVWIHLTVTLVRDETGRPQWFVSVIKDITERKQAAKMLSDSEEKYRELVEQAHDGVVLVQEGKIIFANSQMADMVGYTIEELVKSDFTDHIPVDELPRIGDSYRRRMLGEDVPSIYESVIQHQDGSRLEVEFNAGLTNFEGGPADLVFVRDITERKKAEAELDAYSRRLKALAYQLTLTEEKERRRLAADLHDHIGHSLVLARMQLEAVSKATSRIESNVLLKDVSKLLLEIMHGTKNLIFELSSPIMNEMGLSAAISDWLEEYMERRYGLETELVDTTSKPLLNSDLRAILFRNVRELFTNIIKHANAKKVTVMLKTVAGGLQISIIDDGIGFDYERVRPESAAGAGFGLFSIRERMLDLGGTLEIITKPGEGCRMIMSVPVDSDNSGKDS